MIDKTMRACLLGHGTRAYLGFKRVALAGLGICKADAAFDGITQVDLALDLVGPAAKGCVINAAVTYLACIFVTSEFLIQACDYKEAVGTAQTSP